MGSTLPAWSHGNRKRVAVSAEGTVALRVSSISWLGSMIDCNGTASIKCVHMIVQGARGPAQQVPGAGEGEDES